MVESNKYPRHFWVHNDSGDAPNIYLVNLSGELVATLDIGTKNIDWEDIAIHDNKIYIGEIGDNNAVYPCKKIYRVSEPQIDTTTLGAKLKAADVETMQFNFADSKRDCETLMVDPLSGDLIFVSKREDSVLVYQTPFVSATTGIEIMIKPIATLPITQATAGDISRDGSQILIKNYQKIYYYTRATDRESITQALSRKPQILQYKAEPQGESIAWSSDGECFYTLSEKVGSSMPYIYRYSGSK